MSKTILKEIKSEFPGLFDIDEFVEAWTEWRAACKKKGSVDTVRSWRRHLNHLKILSKGDINLMIKIIDQSSDGGIHGAWTKLYALKGDFLFKDSDY